jgi:hypothetical protein
MGAAYRSSGAGAFLAGGGARRARTWEDCTAITRLVVGNRAKAERRTIVEEREGKEPDVEGHKFHPKPAQKEEPEEQQRSRDDDEPDVEAHKFHPKP